MFGHPQLYDVLEFPKFRCQIAYGPPEWKFDHQRIELIDDVEPDLAVDIILEWCRRKKEKHCDDPKGEIAL